MYSAFTKVVAFYFQKTPQLLETHYTLPASDSSEEMSPNKSLFFSFGGPSKSDDELDDPPGLPGGVASACTSEKKFYKNENKNKKVLKMKKIPKKL